MSPEFQEQFALLPAYLAGHLLLTILALTIGILVSVPLGILASRSPRISRIVLGAAGMIQTIPSIALLALMVPLLGGTIGFLPALIALSLYSILPIIRNTVVGLQSIDPRYHEAALAVGMTHRQKLRLVELPLAFPVVIAGIRTSAVWVVGTATLSTPVGAQSLGNYIFAGLQTRNVTAVLFGCVFAAGLAIILDQILGSIERSAKKRDKRGLTIASTLFVAVFALGLLPAITDSLQSEELAGASNSAGVVQSSNDKVSALPLAGKKITVGSKGFTEQYILSSFLKRYLESKGADVSVIQNMGTTILFDALRNDSVHIYVEYTGTIWSSIMKRGDFPARRPMQIEIENRLLRDFNVLSAGGLGFENAYALAIPRTQSQSLGIYSIDDLAKHAPKLIFAGDPEFFSRAEWRAVRDAYQLKPSALKTMDSTFMYGAARDQQVDVISAYTTDGRLDAYGLVILQDPRQAFPPYDALILLSPAAQNIPNLTVTLRALINRIDQSAMRNANRLVDLEGDSPDAAAQTLERPLIDIIQ